MDTSFLLLNLPHGEILKSQVSEPSLKSIIYFWFSHPPLEDPFFSVCYLLHISQIIWQILVILANVCKSLQYSLFSRVFIVICCTRLQLYFMRSKFMSSKFLAYCKKELWIILFLLASVFSLQGRKKLIIFLLTMTCGVAIKKFYTGLFYIKIYKYTLNTHISWLITKTYNHKTGTH